MEVVDAHNTCNNAKDADSEYAADHELPSQTHVQGANDVRGRRHRKLHLPIVAQCVLGICFDHQDRLVSGFKEKMLTACWPNGPHYFWFCQDHIAFLSGSPMFILETSSKQFQDNLQSNSTLTIGSRAFKDGCALARLQRCILHARQNDCTPKMKCCII